MSNVHEFCTINSTGSVVASDILNKQLFIVKGHIPSNMYCLCRLEAYVYPIAEDLPLTDPNSFTWESRTCSPDDSFFYSRDDGSALWSKTQKAISFAVSQFLTHFRDRDNEIPSFKLDFLVCAGSSENNTSITLYDYCIIDSDSNLSSSFKDSVKSRLKLISNLLDNEKTPDNVIFNKIEIVDTSEAVQAIVTASSNDSVAIASCNSLEDSYDASKLSFNSSVFRCIS